MKIFNIEDGKHKMYMQVEDVKLLVLDSNTPSTISRVICDITFNDKYTDDQFICFDNPRDVAFLDNLDWNVDYRNYKNKSVSEITKEIKNLKLESKELSLDSKEDRRKDIYIEYRIVNLYDIIAVKKGYKTLDLPLVKDYKGIYFKSEDGKHVMYETLSPDKVVVRRTDGSKLSKFEKVCPFFLEKGLSVALSKKIENGETFDKYDISHYFSDDMMNYVSEFNRNLNKKRNINKSSKSLIKKLFNKKK